MTRVDSLIAKSEEQQKQITELLVRNARLEQEKVDQQKITDAQQGQAAAEARAAEAEGWRKGSESRQGEIEAAHAATVQALNEKAQAQIEAAELRGQLNEKNANQAEREALLARAVEAETLLNAERSQRAETPQALQTPAEVLIVREQEQGRTNRHQFNVESVLKLLGKIPDAMFERLLQQAMSADAPAQEMSRDESGVTPIDRNKGSAHNFPADAPWANLAQRRPESQEIINFREALIILSKKGYGAFIKTTDLLFKIMPKLKVLSATQSYRQANGSMKHYIFANPIAPRLNAIHLAYALEHEILHIMYPQQAGESLQAYEQRIGALHIKALISRGELEAYIEWLASDKTLASGIRVREEHAKQLIAAKEANLPVAAIRQAAPTVAGNAATTAAKAPLTSGPWQEAVRILTYGLLNLQQHMLISRARRRTQSRQ